MFHRFIELLDCLGHHIGWCPKWVCDLHEYHITGERNP